MSSATTATRQQQQRHYEQSMTHIHSHADTRIMDEEKKNRHTTQHTRQSNCFLFHIRKNDGKKRVQYFSRAQQPANASEQRELGFNYFERSSPTPTSFPPSLPPSFFQRRVPFRWCATDRSRNNVRQKKQKKILGSVERMMPSISTKRDTLPCYT